MSARPTPWPRADKELLPHTVEKLASQFPDLTYAEYPRNPTSFEDGYRTVTYREFNNAVNGFAWWIEKTIGRPKLDGGEETMVYMGPNDLRYPIFVLGSVKVGYKTLFPTPRYGAEALATLIGRVDGTIMLAPSSPLPIIQEVAQKRPMKVYTVPSLETLLDTPSSPYPYTKTFSASKDDPLIVLHTSGTTGSPKPIIWTHDWAQSINEGFHLPSPPGYQSMEGLLLGSKTRLLTLMPHFHASGFMGSLFMPLYTGTTTTLPPASILPSTAIAAAALPHIPGPVDIIASPPPYIEELGANPALLTQISSKIKSAMWVGGDISVTTGSTISAKMQLFDDLGSTEMGLWPILRPEGAWNAKGVQEFWHYFRPHPALGLEFEAVSSASSVGASSKPDEELYEGVIIRNRDSEWQQPIFKVFTQAKEFRTGDLFTEHPSEKGLWKHYGRADDLLVFATGEKFHPGGVERRVGRVEGVKEVLMVGTRRIGGALIVKVEEGKGRVVKERIWKVVEEEVNSTVPVYARIERELLVVLEGGRPFEKTPKGSVKRRVVEETYLEEVGKAYGQVEKRRNGEV
ncbi:hypothetical protein B0J11DRAFT_569715 [Dendryphion nanum]|uniref:AMP-dependent synthetase/ligase domain-containing protein n=1 Tax=Dendryphion nanum TaxID=256645 RepID=A0A9P9DKK8_9PLEO|nr:hypothetical protein B0J11DRAFT_569715 [Dendryphion nanum]